MIAAGNYRLYLSCQKGVYLLRNKLIRGGVLKNPTRDQSLQGFHPTAESFPLLSLLLDENYIALCAHGFDSRMAALSPSLQKRH